MGLLLGFVVATCLWVVYVYVRSYSARQKVTAALATAEFRLLPPDQPLPPALQYGVARMQQLGFVVAAAGTLSMPSQRAKPVLLFGHPTEPVIAEVTETMARPGQASFGFESILGDYQGWLATQTSPGVQPADIAFRQTFDVDDPVHLLEHHLEGLRYLAAAGLFARHVPNEHVGDAMGWMVRMLGSRPLYGPGKGAFVLVGQQLLGRNPWAGSLATQRDVRATIDRVRTQPPHVGR